MVIHKRLDVSKVDLLESVVFMKNKLKYTLDTLHSEVISFSKLIEKTAWKNFKNKDWNKLPKRRDRNELFVHSYTYPGLELDHKILFYMDTLICDVKRCVEFSIKLLIKSEGFDPFKFSLENFLDQIMETFEGDKKSYVEYLKTTSPEYISFLRSKEKWLRSLNNKRTKISHYKTLNKTQEYSIKFKWDPGKPFHIKPRIDPPRLSLFESKSIMEVLREYEINAKELIEYTSKIVE